MKNVGSYFWREIDYAVNNYYYYSEFNSLYKDSCPLLLNKMNEAIVRKASNNDQVRIDVTISPMPPTKKFKEVANIFDGIVAAFIFSIGMSFIPASLITFTVREREELVKHQ